MAVDATFIGIVLGASGLGATIGFGASQLVQARRSERRAETRDRELPQQVGAILIAELTPIREALAHRTTPDAQQEEIGLPEVGVAYADVNNDGENELLVQHFYGVHGSMLAVYGWVNRYFEFGKLAELSAGAPSSFSVGDLDGDGRVEVATIEADYERGPYAEGWRLEVLYRWANGGFEEVDRRQLPHAHEQWKLRWHTSPIRWTGGGEG